MKAKVLFLTLALGAATCLTAQEGNPPPEGQRPPDAQGGPAGAGERRGPMLMPPRVAEQLNLSSDQLEQVKKLEDEVKAKMEKILTPEQLQQMKQVRPPMQQGGPGGQNPRMGGPGGQPGGPQGGPGMQGGMGGQRPINPILEAVDVNHDGTIQAEELAKASESLKTLDKNGDGKLTPDEFRPPRIGGMGGFQGPGGQGRRGGPGGQGGPGGEGRPQHPPQEQ